MNDFYGEKSFACPHCSVFAQQSWYQVQFKNENSVDEYGGFVLNEYYAIKEGVDFFYYEDEYLKEDNVVAFCMCQSCKKYSLWLEHRLVYPQKSLIPNARNSMPDDVKKLYQEASDVFIYSPRASVALLRLALEMLLPHLGAKKGSINNMISQLVIERKAIGNIKEAMDTLRIIGNNAVHPGEIIFEENDEEYQNQTAISLFKILNYIVVETIESDAMISNLYSQLPEKALKGIENRDKKA